MSTSTIYVEKYNGATLPSTMIGYVHPIFYHNITIHTPAQYIHVAIASEFLKIGQELGSQCTFYCFKKNNH